MTDHGEVISVKCIIPGCAMSDIAVRNIAVTAMRVATTRLAWPHLICRIRFAPGAVETANRPGQSGEQSMLRKSKRP